MIPSPVVPNVSLAFNACRSTQVMSSTSCNVNSLEALPTSAKFESEVPTRSVG